MFDTTRLRVVAYAGPKMASDSQKLPQILLVGGIEPSRVLETTEQKLIRVNLLDGAISEPGLLKDFEEEKWHPVLAGTKEESQLKIALTQLSVSIKDELHKKLFEEGSLPFLHQEFLRLHLFEGFRYFEIGKKLGISTNEVREIWDQTIQERLLIKKANMAFQALKGKAIFEKWEQKDPYAFYLWYRDLPRKCFFCRTEEKKLEVLFSSRKGGFAKHQSKGRLLELQQLDLQKHFLPDNCGHICFFCRNLRQDLIPIKDFEQFLAPAISSFIKEKYKNIKVQQRNDKKEL